MLDFLIQYVQNRFSERDTVSVNQYDDSGWKPLSFFSKKLSQAERKCSTYDRELLAIYSSIKYFRYMLEGKVFSIFTDQKPLVMHSPKN